MTPLTASGCEAVHFTSCGPGVVETGVGGWVGRWFSKHWDDLLWGKTDLSKYFSSKSQEDTVDGRNP